jgi:ABC-2 type transport system permease protein
VLLIAAHLIFGIQWGETLPVAMVAFGIVCVASSAGIFINSFLKNTRQGGIVFGGILTVTGLVGMIGIFAMGSPTAQTLSDTVSLLVPQGWAARGLLQVINDRSTTDVLLTLLVMIGWSVVFFVVGVLRFNRRYA